MANEVYTDYEFPEGYDNQAEKNDRLVECTSVAQYWSNEHRVRNLAVEMTIKHFMNKENVSLTTFQQHLEYIFNFLKSSKV